MRTIPLNIDDMPVGKGNGNGGNLSARGYEGESNADSRFSSSGSGTQNRKKSPRGGRTNTDFNNDDDIKSAPRGQDSEVPYSSRGDDRERDRDRDRGGERGGERGSPDQTTGGGGGNKSRSQYDKDPFETQNPQRYGVNSFKIRRKVVTILFEMR